MSTARISPGTSKDLGLINSTLCRIAGRVVGGKAPNVFTTLGRQRSLFRAWLWYSSKMMPGGKLPRRETELVILRIATNRLKLSSSPIANRSRMMPSSANGSIASGVEIAR